MGEAKRKTLEIQEAWPKQVSLSVADRLWLFNLLPKQGDITSLRIIRELREDLSLSDEENEKFQVQTLDGAIKWNAKLAQPKALSLGRKAWQLISETLGDLEKHKKLDFDCMGLYETFCTPAD